MIHKPHSTRLLLLLGALLLLGYSAMAGCGLNGGGGTDVILPPTPSGVTRTVVGGLLEGIPLSAAPGRPAGPARAPAPIAGAQLSLLGLTAPTDSAGYFVFNLPESLVPSQGVQELVATVNASGYPTATLRLRLEADSRHLLRIRLAAGAGTTSGNALQVSEIQEKISSIQSLGVTEVKDLLQTKIIDVENGTTVGSGTATLRGLTSPSANFQLDGQTLPTVETAGQPWVFLTTGTDGQMQFEILHVPAGPHTLNVSRPGYTTQEIIFDAYAGLTRSNIQLPLQPLATLGNLSLSIQNGNAQTGTAGAALPQPLTVAVRDATGNPVSGIAVTFATGDGGLLDTNRQLSGLQTTAWSDYNGLARCEQWILGPTAGNQQTTAQLENGSSVSFTATAGPAVASDLSLTSAQDSATVGASVVLTALVKSSAGIPLDGVALEFLVVQAPGGGDAAILETQPVLSAGGGQATATLRLSTTAGVHEVEARLADGQTSARVIVTALAGTAAAITVSPAGASTIAAGETLNIQATVVDAWGNPSGNGQLLSFSLVDPDGDNVGASSLSQTSVIAINGQANVTLDPGTHAGDDFQIQVSQDSLSGQSGKITVTAASAWQFAIAQPANVSAGVSFVFPPLTARDAYGNLASSFEGTKTLQWSGSAVSPAGQSPVYTTSAVFSAGVSVTTLTTVLYSAGSTGLTITAGTVSGTSPAFIVEPGNFASFRFEPSLATAVPASAAQLPLVIHLTDAYGNALTLTRTVNLSAIDPLPTNINTISLPATVVATDGKAELILSLSSQAGDDLIVRADVDGISADSPVYSTSSGEATRFAVEIPAGGAQAGESLILPRIIAQDDSGNTALGFNGNVFLRFSGLGQAPNGAEAVVPASVNFVNGIAGNVSLTPVKAENTVITVTDGTRSGVSPALVVRAGVPARIEVQPSGDTRVSADLATQTIIARVFDSFDNPGADGTVVSLAVEDPGTTNVGTGSISPAATTLRDGRINALLTTSTTENDDFIVAVTAGELTARSGIISVGSIGVDRFLFSLPAAPVAGVPFGMIITAVDTDGNPVTSFQGSKSFLVTGPSTAPNGTAPVLPSSISFGQGVSLSAVPFTFYKAETLTLTLQHDGVTTTSAPVTVLPGGLARIALDPADARSVTADNPNLNFRVDLFDNWGNPVADGTTVSAIVLDPGATNLGAAGSVSLTGTSVNGQVSGTLTTSTRAGDDYQLLISAAGILSVSGIISMTPGITSAFAFTSPSNATAGIPFFIPDLRAVDAYGNTTTGYMGTRSLVWSGAANSPSGLPPSWTTTVDFHAGMATTPISTTLKKAEGPINLTVTDGSYSGSGGPLTVEAGPSHRLELTAVPTDGFTDVPLAPAPLVSLYDVFDNLRTNDSSSQVTITLETAPDGASLSGTNPRTVSGGQVSFDDLRILTAGTGYSLRATSGSLTQVSPSFKLDAPPPRVIAVNTDTPDNQYPAGTLIKFTLVFSVPVTVDTLGGTPGLRLAHGPEAGYASGSGTTDLIFHYTVAPGDNSSSLAPASTSALVLNGGSIREGGVVDAQLGLPDPALFAAAHDIVIDTTAPGAASPLSFDVSGGRVIPGIINTTNTNLVVTATIPVGEATGGSAELLVDGASFVPPLVDSTITASDSTVVFDVAADNAAALQARVPAGGNLTVKLTDAAGNSTIGTAGLAFSVDYTIPSAPTAITIVPSGGTIVASTVNATNTNLVVSASIVAGEATGGYAELLIDGVAPAQTVRDETIAASDTSLIFDFAAASAAQLQSRLLQGGVISIQLTDAAGNRVESSVGNPTLIVDYLPPTLPGAIEQLPQTGTVVPGYLNSTNTDLQIRLPLNAGDMAGGLAELWINGAAAIPAVTSGVIAPTDTSTTLSMGTANNADLQARFPTGTYTLGVRLTDAAGNVTLLADLATLTTLYTVPTAPQGPVLNPVGGTVVSNTLNSTNINFTATAVIAAGEATGGWAELLIGGASLNPPLRDSSIAVTDSSVEFDLGATQASEVQARIATGGLVSVRLFNRAGNPSDSVLANPTLTVDYLAPDAPTALTASSSGGTSVPGYLNLSNTNLVVSASIVAGQATGGYAELLVNGLSLSPAVQDLSILAGDTSVTLDLGSGNNSTLQSRLSTGDYVLSVRLVDAAGNPVDNDSGGNLSLTADYTRPASPLIANPALSANTGGTGNTADHINADLKSDMPAFRLNVANTATGAETGNLFLGLKDSAFQITFSTAQAISAGAATAGYGGFPAACLDSFNDGNLQVSAWIRDLAGNDSPMVRLNLTLDSVAPPAPVFASPLIPANLSNLGNTADHVNQRLRNSFADFKINMANSAALAEAGSVYVRLRDAGTSSIDGTGQTIAAGESLSWGGFAAGVANGFVDGDLIVEAWIIDQAGNKSLNASQTLGAAFDTQAPTITVNSLITSDTTPALTGNISDPAATIQLTVNNVQYTASNLGANWLLADNRIDPPLTAGSYDVQVYAIDAAGNGATDTSSNELVIE